VKTASHYTFSGAGRICISLGAPRGAPGGYRMFKALAPSRDILKADLNRDDYAVRYRAEILDKLDPQQTWDELHRLAGGAEPVLQCFEKPPFTYCNFCHRRMVADWFKETLGHDVDEIEPETPADKQRNAAARLAASQAEQSKLGLQRTAIPTRRAVEAVRAEIDAFWQRVCAALFIPRTWSWMGLPDRVRDLMDSTDLDEWTALQARYREVDA